MVASALSILTAVLLAVTPCKEVNLAHFYVKNKVIKPTLIGTENKCDNFGGAEAYSPKYHIRVYVNFNIKAEVDLSEIDRRLDRLPPAYQQFFQHIDLAVADAPWMKKLYHTSGPAVLTWDGSTMFISEKVAYPRKKLNKLFAEIYYVPKKYR